MESSVNAFSLRIELPTVELSDAVNNTVTMEVECIITLIASRQTFLLMS